MNFLMKHAGQFEQADEKKAHFVFATDSFYRSTYLS